VKWIDTSQLAAPASWYIDAHKKLRAAANLKRQARKKYIRNASSVWAAVKPHLEELSNAACWYCEGIYKAGAPNHVDHFRPKGKVVNLDDESVLCNEGYWRLAFDFGNYRLSCHRCNTSELDDDLKQGKANYFPIADEGKRASGARHSVAAVAAEQPLLLDPIDPQDCNSLYFDEDGGVSAVPNANPSLMHRVGVSKRVYFIGRDELVDYRRHLFERCRVCVENISDALDALSSCSPGTPAHAKWSANHDRNADALRQLISGPHSAAVICYLHGRTDSWLSQWLTKEFVTHLRKPPLRLTHSNGEARGFVLKSGSFVVLKGSLAPPPPASTANRGPGARLKATLRKSDVLLKEGNALRFKWNVIFTSRIEALNVVLNDPASPPVDWA